MNYNTNIARHEWTGYITLNMMDCFYVVWNNDVLSKTSLLPIFTQTHGLIYISNGR